MTVTKKCGYPFPRPCGWSAGTKDNTFLHVSGSEVAMRNPLFLDEAVRSVEWQDLRAMTPFQTMRAVLLSSPWLAASLVLAHNGLYALAVPFSVVFFMAGLRQTHDAFH